MRKIRIVQFKHLMNHTSASIMLSSLLLGVIFFVASISNVHTETYNLDKFSIAPETIYSPITIENEKETEQQIREVTQVVEDRYTISESISEDRIEMVTEVFEAVQEVKKDTVKEVKINEQMNELQLLLSNDITEALPTEVFRPLMTAKPEEVESSQKLLVSALHNSFQEGIRAVGLEQEKRAFELKMKYAAVPDSIQPVLVNLGIYGLTENALYDAEKTEKAIKAAISGVEPVMIRSGEVIVEQGATITNDIYEELQLTGLLDNDRNIFPFIGLVLFTMMLACLFYFENKRAVDKDGLNSRHIFVVTAISVFMIVMMKVVSLFITTGNPLYYLMPAATGVFLIKVLCQERLAIVMSIVFALMAVLLFNSQMTGILNGAAGVYMLFSQLSAVYLWNQTKDRLSIVRASAGVSIINICTVLFFLFISFEKYSWTEVILYMGYGIGAAFIAGVLTLGLLPFIETWFGILSDSKLLTLANPNQPLLRKVLIETPGTYHHSIMVANLSESACEAIGANGLLARVGAYYHDLGKTVQPHYFIENQMGIRNPHDFIEPAQSADIILRHPYDGAALLEKEGLPKEIVDIAKQHHGTRLLKYFYYQAKELNSMVKEQEFRYLGPKPQSKEAAVVCVCDSVEAAVRSLDHPTEEKVIKIVQSIIEDRLLDGQFEECDLTFSEIKTMEHAVCETLNGIFHSRIQYPDRLVKEAK